jgi:uncharacterized protein YcnI
LDASFDACRIERSAGGGYNTAIRIAPHTRFGAYEAIALPGADGMGEVTEGANEMRLRIPMATMLAVGAAASLSAHVMVSPLQSKIGTTQKYEVRVHNEAKVAAKSVDLDIPDGVMVTEVGKTPAGTFTTKKTGDRITVITWQIDVQPNKYVALPFTAKNPDAPEDLHWTLHEHLADGSTVDWSDKPGAKEKGSVTKLTAE